MRMMPRARKAGLIVRELVDEVLIYDRQRDKAHCLNRSAGLIWKLCDGQTTTAVVQQSLSLSLPELEAAAIEQVLHLALAQFAKDHLLEQDIQFTAATTTATSKRMNPGLDRRQMLRTLGLATTLAALPVVTSIVAPTPAQAATCIPSGGACSSSAQCCSGLCVASACS